MDTIQPRRPVVFYDGGCPKCRREMTHYQRRAGAGDMDWVDINAHPQALAGTGIRWEAAIRRFHFLDESGRWHTGTEGFIALWRRLPGYRWLAVLAALPGIRVLSAAVYAHWADRHFRRRMRAMGIE